MAVSEQMECAGVLAADEFEVAGVNNRAQLAQLERVFQQRQAQAVMASGVQLMDPARFDLRGSLKCGADVLIDVGCVFSGDVELADGVHIGPHCVIKNARVGPGAKIEAHSVLEDCEIGPDCSVGPFARLRPGAKLHKGAKVGNFVEIKNAELGEGAKAGHLAYIGDAQVGARVNISAGVITCNYDGANKHRTEIGDDAFIGTDTQLVAPISIGAGAFIAAGSTITKDVPDGALGICRARGQKHVSGWKKPTKTGSN